MACRRSGVRVPVAPPSSDRRSHPSPTAGGDAYPVPTATVTETADTPNPDGSSATTRPRSSRAGRSAGRELGLVRTDLRDDVAPKYYLLTMYPYPSGDLHIGHWYIDDADRRARALPADARLQRVLPDRLRRLRAAGRERGDQERRPPVHLDDAQHRDACAASSGRWARCSTGRTRSSPPTRTTTAGTSGSSCSSSKRGLAYRAMAPVDWCPNDGTLAREQVEGADRLCERCGTPVEKRDLEQWFFRITKYADELLDFDGIDWPEPIRTMQTQLDRPLRGRRDRLRRPRRRAPAGGDELARLHDAARHALRRHVHGPGAGASAGRAADHAGAAGRGRGLRRPGAPADRDRAPVDRPREDRRLHRRRRHQPGQRRAHPDLDRRLRAVRLRHRRDHGRAGPRRARLRVRDEVRAADPARSSPRRAWTDGDAVDGGVRRPRRGRA